MKKLFACAMALILIFSLAACGTHRTGNTVNADEFYALMDCTVLLKQADVIDDVETTHYPDGDVTCVWHTEKEGDFVNQALEFSDATLYIYNGSVFMTRDDKLFCVSHFGWELEDFQEYYFKLGIYAPEVEYTLRKENLDGGAYRVTAAFTMGTTAEYYSPWNARSTDKMTYVYEMDNLNRITKYDQYINDALISERNFIYNGEKTGLPKDIAPVFTASVLHKVTLADTVGTGVDYQDYVETMMVPHGLYLTCATGYTLYSDGEHTKVFDENGSPIVADIELYPDMEMLYY